MRLISSAFETEYMREAKMRSRYRLLKICRYTFLFKCFVKIIEQIASICSSSPIPTTILLPLMKVFKSMLKRFGGQWPEPRRRFSVFSMVILW